MEITPTEKEDEPEVTDDDIEVSPFEKVKVYPDAASHSSQIVFVPSGTYLYISPPGTYPQ